MRDSRPALRLCDQCGKPFFPHHGNQTRFCSKKCQRKYYHSHGKTHADTEPFAKVLRTFSCRNCGKTVCVTDAHDKRSVYCSQACEKAYWRKRTRHAYDLRRKNQSPSSA